MIIDHELVFAWGKTLSGSNTESETLDCGQARPTTGRSAPLYCVTTVKEDVTGETSIELQHCDTKSGSYTPVAVSEKLSSPKAGSRFVFRMPETHKRFLKLKYAGATAGKVNSVLVGGYDGNDGYTANPAETVALTAYFGKK